MCFVVAIGGVNAQKTTIVNKVKTPPVIDGVVDGLWDAVPSNSISVLFPNESVSFEGEAVYKAVWDAGNLFVLVSVPDDDFYPGDESGLATWLSDKPELYLDVITPKVDGGAPAMGSGALGHYQFAPSTGEEAIGYEFAFGYFGKEKGNASGYVVEYKIPFSAISYDGYFGEEGLKAFDPLVSPVIGFDVTVIDLDEQGKGVNTDGIGRVNWVNDLAIDESWNNLDNIGDIEFKDAFVCAPYDTTILVTLFKGQEYNGYKAGGKYLEKYTNVQGCDSLIHIYLSVIESIPEELIPSQDTIIVNNDITIAVVDDKNELLVTDIDGELHVKRNGEESSIVVKIASTLSIEQVVVQDASEAELVSEAVSSKEGKFDLSEFEAGSYTLMIKYTYGTIEKILIIE